MYYTWVQSDEEGHTLARWDNGNICESFSHETIHKLLVADELRVERDFLDQGKAALRKRVGETYLADLSPTKLSHVQFKWEVCDRFLQIDYEEGPVSKSDAGMQPIIDRIMHERDRANRVKGRPKRAGTEIGKQKTPPHPSTLREWLNAYEAAGYDPIAFVRKPRENSGGTKLDPEALKLVLKHVYRYASKTRPRKDELYGDLCEEAKKINNERAAKGYPPLEILGRRRFEQWIDELDPFFSYAARYGEKKARERFNIVNRGKNDEIVRPLQLVEMDEWQVNLQTKLVQMGALDELTQDAWNAVAECGRPWITVAIDVCTEMVLALLVTWEPPSEDTAMAALEQIIMPKEHITRQVGAVSPFVYGVPETIAMDANASFVSRNFQARLRDLGIEPFYPPAGLPELRGRIERFFQTLESRVIARFRGRTFRDPVDKGDYDSEAEAVLDLDQLNRVLLQGALDYGQNVPHPALAGETPQNRWSRLTWKFAVIPPPHQDIRRHVLGITCERKIGKRGLRFLGIHYQSRALQDLRHRIGQHPVEVRIDRFDLSAISIYDPGEQAWLTVFARFDYLENVTIWEWIEAGKELGRRNAEIAKLSEDVVLQAIRYIRNTSDAANKKAELGSPVMTSEDLDKVESRIFKGLKIKEARDAGDAEDTDAAGLGFEQVAPQASNNNKKTVPRVGSDASSAPTADNNTQDDTENTDEGRPDSGDGDVGDPDNWTTE